MLDYDLEADRYDETRGGLPRALAAAEALDALLPSAADPVLDIAAGTGIVSGALRERGRLVVGLDMSIGMLGHAARRLPVAQGDAGRLPIGDRSVGGVVIVWLLHLLPDAAPVIAEAARVLRPGGVLITTVDKTAAHRLVEPDSSAPDAAETVTRLAAEHGLRPNGTTTFVGHGQGRSGRADPTYRLLAFRRT